MRKVLKFLLPLVVLSTGVAVFAALKATKPEQPPARIQERVWRVEVEAVRPRALSPQMALYGRVETPDLLKVAASGHARVAEVPVRDGDRVRKGQLLVRLDERDFLPRLHQAEAAVAELQAQILSEKNRFDTDRKALEQEQTLLALARDALERAQRLTKQRVGSETELDKAEEILAQQALAVSSREMSISDHPARLRATEARLQSARARMAEIELDIERASVEAPYDGVVAGVDVTVGDQVKQDSVLLRLYSLEGLEVRARIPAPYQAEMRKALEAGAPLVATAETTGVNVSLTLDRLAGEAHPSGVDGLFTVRSGVESLRLGQMISLRLDRPQRADAVAVPFESVYGGGRIYKLVDGRLRGIQVETLGGMRNGDGGERMLVSSPELAAGDLVVVTHMPNALDGLRVEAIR